MYNENDFDHNLLRQLRRKKNMTQEQLAEELRVKQNSVYNWERGKFAPNRNNTIKLEKIFGVAPGTFSISNPSDQASGTEPTPTETTPPAIENWQTLFFACLHSIAVFSDALRNMSSIDLHDKNKIKKQIDTLQKTLLETINKN